MWGYLIIFACILLAPLLLQGSLSDPLGSGGDLLQESFLQQQASINGQSIPAANIRVLHRWRTHMMCERTGKIMEIDANWLCRTVDGQWLIAIATGPFPSDEPVRFLSWHRPVRIQWLWRLVTEERVRQMLSAEPNVLKAVFAAVGGPSGETARS